MIDRALHKYTDRFYDNAITVPAFVDVHVHLREPGFFYKETIATGTAAAARSGYSCVLPMPNLDPVPDSMEHLKVQLDIIERDAAVKVIPYGSITVGEKGGVLSDMEAMAPFVCGFSDDGVGLCDAAVMEEAMRRAKALGKLIAAHCEDMTLRNDGYIHDGAYARAHGHRGICSESEWRPIAQDLELAAKTGCKYHVCHVSAAESLELIRQAKKSGVDVTCETAPHYLILSDDMLREDGRFKMNPPIRTAKDRQALLEAVSDGTVDMIATDHAPHSAEEKSRGLAGSAMGITGLETAFPMLYTKLVKTGVLGMDRLIELMSVNPRKRFGLPECDATKEYAVWDVENEYVIDSRRFASKGKATPFDGERVFGRCLKTVIDGKTVWDISKEAE